MNASQMTAAQLLLNTWLAHPAELGKSPAKLQCMGEFDHHDLHYYIFRFKKHLLSPWLIGVSGGYEGDSLESAGHVFSHMKPYKEATAEADCRAMVDLLRAYWMNQAKKYGK